LKSGRETALAEIVWDKNKQRENENSLISFHSFFKSNYLPPIIIASPSRPRGLRCKFCHQPTHQMLHPMQFISIIQYPSPLINHRHPPLHFPLL
jgi:hypothetical protein